MNHRALLIVPVLFALVFTGCSKHSPVTATGRPKVPELGVVEVTDGVISRHDLGLGRVCILNPTIKKDGSVLLAMTIEETDSTGGIRTLTQLNAITFPDRAVEVETAFAGRVVGVGLTPHIKP